MKVTVATQLDTPLENVWQRIQRTDTLQYVTKGVLGYSDVLFPSKWREGETVTMRLWLFHSVPLWKHRITVACVNERQHCLQTEEFGGWIKSWNHTLSARSHRDNETVYCDEIEINAGLLTPIVWLIAQFFYRYRQRRWHSWIKTL